MFSVYVLWSDSLEKRYIGSTQDLKQRIKEHNSGMSKFTKGGIPCVLLHSENFETRTLALKRESFLKSGAGRKWLDGFLSSK